MEPAPRGAGFWRYGEARGMGKLCLAALDASQLRLHHCTVPVTPPPHRCSTSLGMGQKTHVSESTAPNRLWGFKGHVGFGRPPRPPSSLHPAWESPPLSGSRGGALAATPDPATQSTLSQGDGWDSLERVTRGGSRQDTGTEPGREPHATVGWGWQNAGALASLAHD